MNDVIKEPKKKKQPTDGESTDPVQMVREGAIAASIWLRQSPSGFAYYDFTVSRSWKTVSTGRTGYSKGFFDKNEAELLSVIRRACELIRVEQAKLSNESTYESKAA